MYEVVPGTRQVVAPAKLLHVSHTFHQFGYVTLFASAFTLAPALAAIATFIEMRSDMWKLE